MTRSVLVTGATSGIGVATVLHLARLGFHAIGSARTPEKGAELVRHATDAGVDVDVVVLDLADPHAGDDVVADLGLWGLVNNAGYMNIGTLEDVPVEAAVRQFHAMVFAPVRLTQLVLPGMRKAGEGRVVNITSIAAHATGPLVGWYQSAKHALSALTDALRAEVTDLGIDVVSIEPGGHRTAIWRRAEADLVARRDLSPHRAAYDRGLEILHRLEPRMPPPEPVAHVVGDALTAGAPRARYRVGKDAVPVRVLDAVTPAPLKDRITQGALRL